MNKDLKLIGNNIKNLRKKSKLKQEQMARFLGVDQSLISKIEKGERAITTDMLEKVSDLFGISPNEMSMKLNEESGFKVAFRAQDITDNDLKAVSDINKIALNLKFMSRIKQEDE